ncbi:MAG TPA: DinB family protein [Thermoplasmata archaeon]|nr:DinB family protein [Thermoplasmata archaeon]
MKELEILRRWFRYNADLRAKYLDAIERLPRTLRRWNDGASFPLLDIYVHVLDAYRWWLRFVYEDRVRDYPRARLRARVRSVRAARRTSVRITKEVQRFVGRLQGHDLDRVIDFRAPANDDWTQWRHERVTIRAMLWHLIEEELQHRGEMNALLWRHGVEPPVIGFHEWTAEWAVVPER